MNEPANTEQPAAVSLAPADPLDPPERPTRVRYGVLGFLAAMTFVLYLDRVCIGQAAPRITSDLGLSDTQMGFVLAAFTLAYGLFEIPSGRWGDRYGSRGVLTRIVVWWSAFTALTGAATGFGMLLAVRFLFGAGEAGALPNSARVLKSWFPESARGRAQGLVTTAMLLGGGVAPIVSQQLISLLDWRWTFAVFGLLGLAWAGAFYLWFRDDPAHHPAVNDQERALIAGDRPHDGHAAARHGPIPWSVVFACSGVWRLGGAMITMTAIYYMLFSWYPTYLQEARGASPVQSARLSSMVLGVGAAGCLFGGWFTDWLTRTTGSRRWGRTAQSVFGAGLAAAGILGSVFTDGITASAVLVAIACLGVQLQVPAWWASATQVSGRHLGALFGLMNMIGALGGIASQLFMGRFADLMKGWGYSGRARWDPGFFIYTFVALIGMAIWCVIDPTKTVDDEPASA